MKMNKTYSRVVVPKDLDTGTSTETSTWIAKNISRVYYLPMVVSADADIKKKTVMLRLDLNVPYSVWKISDASRIPFEFYRDSLTQILDSIPFTEVL